MKRKYMFEINVAQASGHNAGIGVSVSKYALCGGILLSAPS